jgi:hypothetical protein
MHNGDIKKGKTEAHRRLSFEFNSSYIELYGVPNGYMLGLSIEGPGSRTAEPVPDEVTRWPALLVKKLLTSI